MFRFREVDIRLEEVEIPPYQARLVADEGLPEEVVRHLELHHWVPSQDRSMLYTTELPTFRLHIDIGNLLERLANPLAPGVSLDIQEAKGTHYLVLVPGRISIDEASAICKQRGLPMRRNGSVLRGKFCLELYKLLQDVFDDEIVESSAVVDFAASSTAYAVLEDDFVAQANRLFPQTPEYQFRSIAFLTQRKRCILAAGPGSGKTVISTLAASMLGRSVVVLAPLTLHQQWRETMRRANITGYITNPEKLLTPTAPADIAHYLRSSKNAGHKQPVLIVDESSLYRNRKTKRYKAVAKLVNDFEYVWLLSGTPMVKSAENLWAQLNIVDKTCWPSFWGFVRRYCIVETNNWGTHITGNLPGTEAQIREYFRDVLLAYRTEDVLNLEDWNIQVQNIRMSEEQERVYLKAKRDLLVELTGEENFMADRIAAGQAPGILSEDGNRLLINTSLASMTRSIQIASNPVLVGSVRSSPKWDQAISLARDLSHMRSRQGIVWFLYRKTGEELLAQLGGACRGAVLDGTVSPAERTEILEKFSAGDLRILLLQYTVGRFGLNLQNASWAIFLERSFDQEAFFQAMYRTRRFGSERATDVYILLSTMRDGRPTVDMLVDRSLNMAQNRLNKLLKSDLLEVLR